MLILLPPSESKRPGGIGRARLNLQSLRFPELLPERELTARALTEFAALPDRDHAATMLGIPRTLVGELDVDAALFDSPLLPAVDRYTGVLYDALDASNLPAEARRHLGRTVAIHSAVFGPIGALDRIPDYRMSSTSRLPGIRLRSLWAPAVTGVLSAVPGPIIDLRSEGYVALGPVGRGPTGPGPAGRGPTEPGPAGRGPTEPGPAGRGPTGLGPTALGPVDCGPTGPGPAGRRDDAVFVRVVTAHQNGTRRALNHFNKHAKGLLARAFALQCPRVRSVDGFVHWARSAGFRMESVADHEVQLVVD